MSYTRLQSHWLGIMGAYALLNGFPIVGAILMLIAAYTLRVAGKAGL